VFSFSCVTDSLNSDTFVLTTQNLRKQDSDHEMQVKRPKPWPILSIPNHGQIRWSLFCPPLSPKRRCSEPFASSRTLPKLFAFSSGLSKVGFPTQLSPTSSCYKFWVAIGTSTWPETCFFPSRKSLTERSSLRTGSSIPSSEATPKQASSKSP